MTCELVSHNGKLIPKSEAKISIDNIEWNYGFGVYENLKFRHGITFFVDQHVERLFSSAKAINLDHEFTKDSIKQWIKDLTEAKNAAAFNIKVLLVGGSNPNLYIQTLAPKFVEKRAYSEGVHVATKQYERYLPQAKTLNMLPSYLIFTEGKEKSAHDVLLVNTGGKIIEGTRSNFFAIKGKMLYTAPIAMVLNGVTRQTVIECAKQNGYHLTEEPILSKNVQSFDGAFLTNTSGKIIPIKSIDNFFFPKIVEDTKILIKLYNEYLDNYKAS